MMARPRRRPLQLTRCTACGQVVGPDHKVLVGRWGGGPPIAVDCETAQARRGRPLVGRR